MRGSLGADSPGANGQALGRGAQSLRRLALLDGRWVGGGRRVQTSSTRPVRTDRSGHDGCFHDLRDRGEHGALDGGTHPSKRPFPSRLVRIATRRALADRQQSLQLVSLRTHRYGGWLCRAAAAGCPGCRGSRAGGGGVDCRFARLSSRAPSLGHHGGSSGGGVDQRRHDQALPCFTSRVDLLQ